MLADDAGADITLAAEGIDGSEAGPCGGVASIGMRVTVAVGAFGPVGAAVSGVLLLQPSTAAAHASAAVMAVMRVGIFMNAS